MKLSDIAIPSIRFGFWTALGVHMHTTGMEANSQIIAFIAGLVMFSYAGSIILEAIFKMNKESKRCLRKSKTGCSR